MDTKRLALAIVISCVVFLGWNYLSVQMGWVPPPADPATQNATTISKAQPQGQPQGQLQAQDPAAAGDPAALPSALAEPATPAFAPEGGRLVTVETPLYKAVFHSNGGILREFLLKKYGTTLQSDSPLVDLVTEKSAAQAPLGLLLDGAATWMNTPWKLEGDNLTLAADGSGVLRFVGEVNGTHLVRELVFTGDSYTINEKLRVSSETPKTVKVAFTFGASSLASGKNISVFARLKHSLFGGVAPSAEENQYNPTRVSWYQETSFSEDTSTTDLTKGKFVQGKVSWMAVMNNYFMGAVSMPGADASAKGRFFDGVYHVLIGKTGVAVSKDQDSVLECAYFLGPKESKVLSTIPNHMEKALDYGMFSIVAKPLVHLLQFFYDYVGNYGMAIILMTVVIKLVFWPLSQKSYKSMQQMKQLQPMMAKIREKYADDKETMNREVMQLYKTYKVNPAGGCLPILVQIPVFFGLYQALLNAIELRHAPFVLHLPFTEHLWLADLAAPDPYFITPLVMGASMFLQQKMTPTPGDPTQAKIMMFMPLIFTVLFINFPSGLVVYWLVNNIISIGQQWWQLRRS